MDAGTEADEALRQQQQLFAAQMQNGPARLECVDEPFEELKSRFNEASGAYMLAKENGGVSPEEETIYRKLQAQYSQAKAKQDELHKFALEATADGSRRRKASPSPLFVQQDQPNHHQGFVTTDQPSGNKRKRAKTSKDPLGNSSLPEVDASNVYSVSRLIADAPANKEQAAIRDGERILHAIKRFPPGSVEYAGGHAWSLSGMKTSVKNYQLINIAWMNEQESNGIGPSGGILADEMGLGKTVCALASMVHGNKMFGRTELETNLVVVRPTLKAQWFKEARHHTERPTSKNASVLGRIYRYNPATGLELQLEELEESNLVIASYSDVKRGFRNFRYPEDLSNAEKETYFDKNYRPSLSALFQYRFRAIYLDEGHDIRNPTTLQSMACQKLQSEYRWILTGTPMTNNPTDLYSVLTFVRDPEVLKLTLKEFNDYYKGASKKDINVKWLAKTLQRCMSRWTLSATLFGRPLVDLSKPIVIDICRELSVPEMVIYSTLRDRLKALALERSLDPDSTKSYKYIDGLLTVLRQMTGHVLSIRPIIFKYLTDEDMNIIYDTIHDYEITALSGATQMSVDQRIGTESTEPLSSELHTVAQGYMTALRKLQKSSTCIVCKDTTQDFKWAECYHAYCKGCLDERMRHDAERGFVQPRCKPCGLPMGQLICEAEDAEDKNPRWLTKSRKVIPSTKSSVAVELIKSWRDPLMGGDPRAKVVMFTMFKECHKFLAATFKQERWSYMILTAEMSAAEKDRSVEKFMNDPDKFIMLATTGVGGIGLNLMAAQYVFVKRHPKLGLTRV
jgi:SNF2 family DNA or RNA helicase